jgi:hypothetical protein
MALDPNAANIHELMSNQIENYGEKILQLEDELNEILLSINISVIDLFHRVAIR